MKPGTARLVEMGLGGGLGALLGGGAGYLAGEEGDRPVGSGALLGGLAGVGGAGAISIARRSRMADQLRSAALHEANEARGAAQSRVAPLEGQMMEFPKRLQEQAQQLRQQADDAIEEAAKLRVSANRLGFPAFVDAADASEQAAQKLDDEAHFMRSVASQVFRNMRQRLKVQQDSILGAGEMVAVDAQAAGRQKTREMQGSLFGGRDKTSQAAYPGYYQQQQRPVGPLWGALGAGAAGMTAAGLGERFGELAGSDLVQRLRARAATEVDPVRAAALLSDAAKAKAIAPKAGLYGGALLGIPLALHVGKFIAQSPRTGFMEYMP